MSYFRVETPPTLEKTCKILAIKDIGTNPKIVKLCLYACNLQNVKLSGNKLRLINIEC